MVTAAMARMKRRATRWQAHRIFSYLKRRRCGGASGRAHAAGRCVAAARSFWRPTSLATTTRTTSRRRRRRPSRLRSS
eukprot:2723350-Prymnesium_polylepis.1